MTSTDAEDYQRVSKLLGRPPRGAFDVAIRDHRGDPVVIRNAPFLEDGTPMPTRYWLVEPELKRRVDGLEAAGGVRRAEKEVDPEELRAAHDRYARERDGAVPEDWSGNRPSGGVGGARTGVKCLHAHYAWYLAGGDDPVGRWVAAQLGDTPERAGRGGPAESGGGPVAAIDCGTNSTRLLIADRTGVPLERLMTITRLGQGVDQTKALREDAVSRTVDVLRRYRQLMDRYGVARLRITATSAARDATNREAFFAACEDAVGARPELLKGAEEGRLSFVGATAGMDPRLGPFLIADIGGGSTELAVGDASLDAADPERRIEVRSLDVGCVRLTERFLVDDPPTAAQIDRAAATVAELLDDARQQVPAFGRARTFLGLAGTVSAVATMALGLDRYDRDRVHHARIDRATVGRLRRELAALPLAERRQRPGLEAERADVIVGGIVVLETLLRAFDLRECLVSEADILDGLASTLLVR